MNIAYVISAYKLPEQLVRLVRRLTAPGTSFVVHVDRKSADEVQRSMIEGLAGVERVEFLPRHRCRWGGFGHVRATLKGIDYLLRNDVAFDYLVLLTGQDYPLQPPASIARLLEQAKGRSFMSSWTLPHASWSGRGGLARIQRWHVTGPGNVHIGLRLRRRPLSGFTVFGGSPYWCLSRPLVEHVQRVVETRPDVVRFFEHAFIPDELFFQTVLMNSAHAESIVDDNLRYIDWAAHPGPKILREEDLPRLLVSDKLFARKFDATVDADVLDRLDEHLLGQLQAAAK